MSTVQDDRAANKRKKNEGASRRRSGSNKRKRAKVVFTRVDDDEYAKLVDYAARARLTISSYLRKTSIGVKPPRKNARATPRQRLAAKFQAELGRIGNNINQLAHVANRGQYDSSVHEETLAELKQLARVLRRIIRSKE